VGVGGTKDRNRIRDLRASVCIEEGFRYVTLEGTSKIIDDQATAQAEIAALARRYHDVARAEELARDVLAPQDWVSLRLHPNRAAVHGFGGEEQSVNVALAGGVGGAKMAQGLQAALPPGDLTVVVNTADDFELYGLYISPDLDTVMYTLAGVADPVNGWGVAGDTRNTLDAIARYGEAPWFLLGDQDFATHILRTERLRAGMPLSVVTTELSAALGIQSRIVPMTDDRVATLVETPAGTLEFQDYFVGRRQSDDVLGVTFAGIERATAHPDALAAIREADAVVIAPSNPIVSVAPILDTPGVREAMADTPAPIVAVSPIVGGHALKGPAAQMLATLGHEVSALGVARLYADVIDGLVIDEVDRELGPTIELLGPRVLVTATVMGDEADRRRLAVEVLDFAASLARERAVAR
jgi:LPPG:FO 2-phospho-L-lactate transferase